MNNKISTLFTLSLALFLLNPCFGLASEDLTSEEYEEVSYEDLLGRISNKKTHLKKEILSPFDEVLIHMGLGYVTTFSNNAIPDYKVSHRLSGLQLTLGINLFSPHWYSEANWRNFGVSSNRTQEISLRELDFRIGYTNDLSSHWNYKIGTGLATRFMHFSDNQKFISYDSTTPALLAQFGVYNSLSRNISIGSEVSMQSPLATSLDRGGWALSLQTQGSF